MTVKLGIGKANTEFTVMWLILLHTVTKINAITHISIVVTNHGFAYASYAEEESDENYSLTISHDLFLTSQGILAHVFGAYKSKIFCQ